MEVMNAKQTMIRSFPVSMLAPQEKHDWQFCFLRSFNCTYGSDLTLYHPTDGKLNATRDEHCQNA